MTVPEHIRNVARPSNTVVTDSKRDTPLRYAVRERKGVTYVKNGYPQPRNGRVIGHIIEGKFVPSQPKASSQTFKPFALSYGVVALARDLSKDIQDDLLAIYSPEDAFRILVVAILQIVHPSVTAERISTWYNKTYACVYYPGLALSPNTLSKFYALIGQNMEARLKFFELRMQRVMKEHHIIIDGMLKQDNSTVNDLSKFSYKSRLKGIKNISILYAYDYDLMEPICCQVFPGNSIDASSYESFIRTNGITRGIIIDDKGFPVNQIRNELKKHEDLHYLTPLKRNDVRIRNNNMSEYDGVLKGISETVFYKKAKIKGGSYLYSFMDQKRANAEIVTFAHRVNEAKADFSKYETQKERFGTITFISDQDLDPLTVYLMYRDRWTLELVFKSYKSDLELATTGVHGDFSVHGKEFVNFISTLITTRIIRKEREAGLLDKMTYGNILEDLNDAWRMISAPEHAKSNDGYWYNVLPSVMELLEKLGLSEPEPKPEPKKRGRPRKEKEEKPKRPRGRPRKNAPKEDKPKRPRGRPRKHPKTKE